MLPGENVFDVSGKHIIKFIRFYYIILINIADNALGEHI